LAVNTTIAANSLEPGAYFGGGGGFGFGANAASTNGILALRNSLLAYPGTNENTWGTITDSGYNISSDGSAGFNSGSSFNFTDPKLFQLADNGGGIPTMALAPDSPAIDWAPVADAPATDQRGYARGYGGGIDLGAFEIVPPVPPLSAFRSGTNLNVSFVGQAGVRYRIQRSSDLMVWETEENTGPLGANGVVSRTYPATQPRRFFRLTLDF
jgi:hypothetical protein